MDSTPTSLPTTFSKRRARGARGFTLIELLVVIALIAFITALVVPSISSYFQVSINSATRQIGTTVKDAYNSTVLTGRVYRIVYDLKKNQYWVESGPPDVLLDTEESLKKAQDDLFNDDKPAPNPFVMDRTVTRSKVKLPRGIVFEDVITQQSKTPITDGLAYTHFFPHGITEQTIIHLKDSSDHHASLVISPLVGNTDVYDRYIKLEEAFGKNNAGFTLLEVLIAVAIMVMSLAAILAIEGGSINASSRAKRMNIVAMLARNEMIKTEYELEGKTFDEVDKEKEGKFDPPFDSFTWKRTIKELTFPNFASLASQNDSENQVSDLLSKLFSNYLSKALREVTIEVIWQKSGKPQSVSVTTYWVDLNHEFNLSE